MKSRTELENDHNLCLKPFAVPNTSSCQRQHDEDEHDYRTAFQRDLARVVHTSAFRRLEYKTQVFVNHEGDYYRTRLTHTLEVAQIARTIARALGVNEDLTEVICLAHDLGHTPFGHAGQDVMSELMKNHGGFEHNQQSFRIVTQLENPYPDFKGLNLTQETLEGITKHKQKYFFHDNTEFKKTGFPSLEAQIANISDEIAYNNHDIDDGLKSGLIDIKGLSQVTLWAESWKIIDQKHPHLNERDQTRLCVKFIINRLVTDLLENTTLNIKNNAIQTQSDVKTKGLALVSYSQNMQARNAELKRFLFENLYRHYRVERMALKAQSVIRELFNAYLNHPQILPPFFLNAYPKTTPLERIICDYIAGMTDRFAYEEHSKLFDPKVRV